MKTPTAAEINSFLHSLPGKRGIDIPEELFDQIHAAARGVTRKVWGSNPTPQQLAWLHDNGHHTPEKVTQAFNSLPHPHAPSVNVGEYEHFSRGLQLFNESQGDHGH